LIYNRGLKLKNKKLLLVSVATVVLFIALWTYFFWYPQFVLDQRIEELKKEGANVEMIVYDVFYLDETSSSPQVVFTEKQSWSDFKQDVMTAKANIGSVIVSVDRDARTFVLAWNETTYYYYQVP
jgi:hypothetical protein